MVVGSAGMVSLKMERIDRICRIEMMFIEALFSPRFLFMVVHVVSWGLIAHLFCLSEEINWGLGVGGWGLGVGEMRGWGDEERRGRGEDEGWFWKPDWGSGAGLALVLAFLDNIFSLIIIML
jgi:hypothetical protein